MRFLQMLHENSDHDIDKDELGHQNEHHEEERSDEGVDTAVLETLLGGIALLPQGVLHDPIPVITWHITIT